MGSVTFTGYFHLLVTGREATEEQRFFLDLLLVAIAEHGMMPTNVAARMTLAADPGSLQGAVAAGILGAGPVILGTSELCASLLEQAQVRVVAGEARAVVAREMAEGSAPLAAGRRASAIPCTARSTHVRSASSSSRTHAVRVARTLRWRASSAVRSPRPGAGR